MEIISVKNLSVKYQNNTVLHNISFTISRGDYVAVVGPNGAGKTTLIKTMLGLIEKSDGKINFNSRKIGYLQQKVSLNDSNFPANAKEIIRSGLLINKKAIKIFLKKDSDKVKKIIELLGIKDLENKLIGKLSGGQLQKVLLARTLISEPEILFLDEPATALDPLSRDNFYNIIKDLNKKNKTTVLLISHDIGSAGKFANKMLYIDHGLIFFGTFKEFCESSEMTKYFGDISQHFFCQRHE